MDDAVLAFVEVGLHWAAIHRWEPGDAITRMGVKGYALWLVLDGCIEVTMAERAWRLSPQTACLLPSQVARDIATPDGARWLSVGLSADVFGRVDVLRVLPAPVAWQPEAPVRAALETWMRQMEAEWVDVGFSGPGGAVSYRMPLARLPTRRPRSAVSEMISLALARAAFGLLWRELGGESRLQQTPLDTPPWLTRTLQHVAREPGTEVHDLARIAGVSPAQFRRSFHTWVGTSPQSYLTRRRMEEARHLLITSDLVVSAIAERVGFESASYFTRLFKQEFGVSPARYRRASRQPGV